MAHSKPSCDPRATTIKPLMVFKPETIRHFPFHSNSEHGGHPGLISLGSYKNYSCRPEGVTLVPDKLYHDEGPTRARTEEFSASYIAERGLSTTKFGRGFQRRKEEQITNPLKDVEKQYHEDSSERKLRMNSTRTKQLNDERFRYGYNIVTCEEMPGGAPIRPARATGLRMLGDGLGPEAPLRGVNTLRESSGRFFVPQYSGNNHDYRQDVLKREGILTQKSSSLLQLGKADIPSSGVEDQFSKAEYMKLSDRARFGLAELTAPGRYTPRKQPGNPSGDEAIRKTWAKNIIIN